jgi:hypothetical protein
MARRADAAALGPFLGVIGALVLLGAAVSSWIDEPVARAIGDVAVAGTRATPGVEIAPSTVVTALAGLLCSVGLLLTRNAARRTVSLLLAVLGVVALAVVIDGIVVTTSLDGDVTLAPWLAVLGATAVLAAGLVGFGRPGRRMPARYDVGFAPEDAEWHMASGGGEAGRPASYASPSHVSDPTDDEAEQR